MIEKCSSSQLLHARKNYLTSNPSTVQKTSHLFFISIHLTLEGKGGADLVASLVELGGVKGETEAEGGAGVELGAVSEGGDTAVVDLDLLEDVELADWNHSDDGHRAKQ